MVFSLALGLVTPVHSSLHWLAVGDQEAKPCAKLRVSFNLVKVSKRKALLVFSCGAQWPNEVKSRPRTALSGHRLMIHGFFGIRTWKKTSTSTWTFCHPRCKAINQLTFGLFHWRVTDGRVLVKRLRKIGGKSLSSYKAPFLRSSRWRERYFSCGWARLRDIAYKVR